MKRFLVVGLVLATVLAMTPAAVAGPVTFFYFTLTGVSVSNGSSAGSDGTGMTASGILEATGSGNSYTVFYGYDIMINGVAANIVPTSAGISEGGGYYISPNAGPGGFNYDNIVNTSLAHYVDNLGGLLFDIPNTADQYLLWWDAGGDLLDGYNTTTTNYNPLDTYGYDVSMSMSEISPEPPSLLLLGTGLFLMAGLLFWKVKSNTLAPSMNHVA
jgi:hypothetical protein